MNWPKRYWYYLKTWRKHRETIKQLNKLTDQQLSDIGLSRGQLEPMIWLEVDREYHKQKDN